MGGLMVLIAIALFTGFCWLLSGWIIRNKTSKYYNLKRGVVFLIPALMPVYVQVVEYVLFQQACKEAVAYFPEEKLKLSDVIVSNSSLFDDPDKDFNGIFKYVIAPHYSNKRPIDLTKSKEQFNDYIVHPYKSKSKPLEGKEEKNVLNEIRYALVFEPPFDSDPWYFYSVEYYIYDFKKHKKIASINKVLSRNYRNAYGYFHIKLNDCEVNNKTNNKRALTLEGLIANTFTLESN